jgi:hypothetical protein
VLLLPVPGACCCCLRQVGLLYIHDPQFSPQQHADLAKKLCANFGGKLEMGVLKVRDMRARQRFKWSIVCFGSRTLRVMQPARRLFVGCWVGSALLSMMLNTFDIACCCHMWHIHAAT